MNRISFGSEQIVRAMETYIRTYPDPYVPVEVLLTNIVEECITYEHYKHCARFSVDDVSDIVCSNAMELLDSNISIEMEEHLLSTGELIAIDNDQSKYLKIINDHQFNDQVVDIVSAIHDELSLLKIDRDIAPILEYVENAIFNGASIIMDCIYEHK